MSVRSTEEVVTFSAPFTLPGLDRSYPAGSYKISIDDEMLDVSFDATRRLSTRIALVRGPVTQSWPVDPKDLETALAADAAKRAPQAL